MSEDDYSKNLESANKNIGLELARISDQQSQWDWLTDHLRVYLLRLEMLCNELNRPPSAFAKSSVFCCLLVACDHIDRILLAKGGESSEWTSFKKSLEDLPNAENVTSSLLCLESFLEADL